MKDFKPVDFSNMQGFFSTRHTISYAFRKAQLLQLKKAIQANETAILQALYQDLHKSAEEAFATEIGFIYKEINYTISHLKQWMEADHVSTPFMLFPSSSKVSREPWGICLIIAPWNYPFQLLMAPLIGAIAGGNTAVLKPSEMTPHTAAVVEKMMIENFDPNYISVVVGNGAEVVPKLMDAYRFDHVFFTGSTAVGRQIAIMAAEKLVPVSLELGGKSPCIVDKDADLAVAAKRITWGKFTNAGQTCVAPDYLLVHASRKAQMVALIQKNIKHFYGVEPNLSAEYGRIVNQNRLQKIVSYFKEGNLICGGKTIPENLYVAPTLMDNIIPGAAIMKEEIFGPILPIISYENVEDAVLIIRKNPNPLSLYYFGNNRKTEKIFTEQIAFGGGCINNTLVHLANEALPFGGVGNSGLGNYHGKFSFEAFTRPKSVLKSGTWLDPSIKYPPYKGKLKILKWLMK